jgi:hypothetical protein
MSLAIDEFGRAYIVIKEQDKKKRLKGQEAFKVINSFNPFYSCFQFNESFKILNQI